MAATNGNGNTYIWLWVLGLVFGAVTILLQALSTVVWGNFSKDITQLQHEIEAVATSTNKEFVRIGELRRIDETLAHHKEIDDSLRLRIQRMSDQYIPRFEYLAKHVPLEEDIKRLQTRIDELDKRTSTAYTLSDKLKELQEAINRLQNQVLIAPNTKAQQQ